MKKPTIGFIGLGLMGSAMAGRLQDLGYPLIVLGHSNRTGIDAAVRVQLINTAEAAEAQGFRGSPTLLINGTDPFADPDAPVGLSCRVYLTPDGMAGSPTIDQISAAITDLE